MQFLRWTLAVIVLVVLFLLLRNWYYVCYVGEFWKTTTGLATLFVALGPLILVGFAGFLIYAIWKLLD